MLSFFKTWTPQSCTCEGSGTASLTWTGQIAAPRPRHYIDTNVFDNRLLPPVRLSRTRFTPHKTSLFDGVYTNINYSWGFCVRCWKKSTHRQHDGYTTHNYRAKCEMTVNLTVTQQLRKRPLRCCFWCPPLTMATIAPCGPKYP